MASPAAASGTWAAKHEAGERERVSRTTVSVKDTLHLGDLVLLTCNLASERRASSGSPKAEDTGYVRACGLTGEATAVRIGVPFHQEPKYDLRDFLFVVDAPLSYTAQADLRRLEKHLARLGSATDSFEGFVRTAQARAEDEAKRNLEAAERRERKPLSYGSVVQLRHLRTKQYLSVNKHSSAALQGTSRRVELQEGSNCSWFRVNPRLAHKVQGEPVPLNEVLNLENSMLAEGWNLNWAKCRDRAGDQVFEINCSKQGEGFGFALYNRAVEREPGMPGLALGFGVPVRIHMPHFQGSVCASVSPLKTMPYLRRPPPGETSHICAKTIWIPEVISVEAKELGIAFRTTPVLLRHFASGRYLSLRTSELVEEGHILEGEDMHAFAKMLPGSPTANRFTSLASTGMGARQASIQTDGGASVHITAELVAVPRLASLFVLEPDTYSDFTRLHGGKLMVAAEQPTVMLRWDHSFKGAPLWLNCRGQAKGVHQSLELFWSGSHNHSSVVRLDLVAEGAMRQHDVVLEHRLYVSHTMKYFERCQDARVALHLYLCLQRALSDMIFFLADAPEWRHPEAKYESAMHINWRATPERQVLVRELRYIDLSFELLQELRKQTPGMMAEINFEERHRMRDEESARDGKTKQVKDQQLSETTQQLSIEFLRVHCLKLVVRMWVFCFFHSREAECHFYKRGWMNQIDNLNGYGVGASDIFVALVSDNPVLVRRVGDDTLSRFIHFIRVLGPLDTWLNFLLALCAPQGKACAGLQQEVCINMVFAGLRGVEKSKEATARRNKEELLVSMRVDAPIGVPLAPGAESHGGGGLGRRVLLQGIHDIGIAWTHPAKWEVGRAVLFHGPDHLLLAKLPGQGRGDRRTWVSLLHVVWPLQPERCFEYATGRQWSKLGKESMEAITSETRTKGRTSASEAPETRIAELRMLAKYILAQLRLMAGLAKERQMNCIMALQDEFTPTLCLTGAADVRLPSAIRAAFFDLLTDLWIDRHPHIQIVVPRLFRCLPERRAGPPEEPTFRLDGDEEPDSWSPEHLRNLSEEARDFYRMKTPEKMEAFVHAVRQYLWAGLDVEQQVHSAEEDNMLMSAALRALIFLIRFGFAPRSMMIEVVGPLLRCLDGRTDFLAPPAVDVAADPSANGSEDPLYPEITPLLHSRPGPRDQGRQRFTRSRFPPAHDSAKRYLDNSDNKRLTESKVRIAHVLHQVKKYRLEAMIAKIVQRFRMLGDGASARAMADEVLLLLDDPPFKFEQERIGNPNVMFLDLAMYENPTLFAMALDLMIANTLIAAELFDHLSRVKLMATELQELTDRLKFEVATVGKLIYSFETWLMDDGFSGLEAAKFQQLSDICRGMRHLCQFGGHGVTSRLAQGILCETEFFSHVRYVLTLNPVDFAVNCRPMLAKAISLLCGVASSFVRANPGNQNLMMQVMPFLEELVDEQPECAVLAAEVFRDNMELSMRIPEKLIKQFGELVARERRAGHFVPWYLSFLTVTLSANQKPVPRNQVLVLETIKTLTPKSTLRLGKDMNERSLADLAARFTSHEYMKTLQPSHWNAKDGEIIYYCCCVDLCADLARGSGVEALVLKPFVNSLFPVATALRLLMVIEIPHHATNAPSMHRLLRVKWLAMLNAVFYDVAKELLDYDLFRSPLHVQFLGRLIEWLMDLLGLQAPEEGRSARGSGWGPRQVSAFEGEYLRAVLVCVDSLFGGPVLVLKREGLLQEMLPTLKRFHDHFAIPLRAALERTHEYEDWELLQVAAHRVANVMGDTSASTMRLAKPPLDPGSGPSARGEATERIQAEWDTMLEQLTRDPRIKNRLAREESELGRTLWMIREHTDPEEEVYSKQVPVGLDGELPANVDFRRGKISVEEMLRRWASHFAFHPGKDLPSLRRVQRCLLLMIRHARRSEDPNVLQTLQATFVDAGIPQLMATVLDARLAQDIADTSWRMLGELLSGAESVNKYVQEGLYRAMTSMDDSGLFQSFYEQMEAVGLFTKRVRALKAMPSLTAGEEAQLLEYREAIKSVNVVLNSLYFMVEGHFNKMQDYFFSQDGNSRTINVLETARTLLQRMCKDETAADMCSEDEVGCVQAVLTLLIACAQGPNLRNQKHLSTFGLAEVVFKLLSAGFWHLQRAKGDLYPSTVRRLKSQFVQLLLAQLEGRQDKRIHASMTSRVDVEVVRKRITFVYLYFVFGTRDISMGKVESVKNVAIPLKGQTQRLFSPSVDPTELYIEVDKADDLAFDLLEDLEDDELDELFSEGLDLLQLTLELKPLSKALTEAVEPRSSDFVDDPTRFITEKEYLRSRTKFHKAEVYRLSYQFLRRFVRSIEVVLGGHLQVLHFQQPLTAMFYTHDESKQQILATVPFSSPDIKAKAFIQMCQKVHRESQIIRQLSKFSLLTGKTRKWAQVHLPDGAHRPFNVFLRDDAWRMQQLLKLAITVCIVLSAHVGMFLVPSSPGSRERGHLIWVSPLAERVATALGLLYAIVTTIWLGLTACITLPLNMQTLLHRQHMRWRLLRALHATLLLMRKPGFAWRALLLTCCTIALVSEHAWIFSFLLADCFYLSPRLATVLGGVVSPLTSLFMTSLGATIVTFAYAAVGFHYFRKDFGAFCEDSVIVCTQNIIYQSTRNGIIGLSSMMEQVMPDDDHFPQRVIYDVSFFIVTGIMLLNTVVALIVDSFSSQRRAADAREINQETETFISCLDRKLIETVATSAGISDGFEFHETVKQPKWDYMSFIFFLREKNVIDYTGPEQIIRKLVEEKDVKWLPLGRSKMVEEDKTHIDEDVLVRVEKQGVMILQELEGGKHMKSLIMSRLKAMSDSVEDRLDLFAEQLAAVDSGMAGAAAPIPADVRNLTDVLNGALAGRSTRTMHSQSAISSSFVGHWPTN